MPIDYPIPPWLSQTPDWGGMSMRRSALKAQIAESSAKMAQEQQQFQSQMEMKQMAMQAEQVAQEKQLKMQAEIAKHKIAVEQAYHQVTAGLQAAQLQEASRKIDLDYFKEARDVQGREEAQGDIMEQVKRGVPIEQAYKNTVMTKGIGLNLPASAFSAVRNSERGNVDVTVSDLPGGGGARVAKGGGRWQILPPVGKATGETEIKQLPGGLVEVTPAGGKARVMKGTPFKFSKQDELKAIDNSEMGKYLRGEKTSTSDTVLKQVDAARKKRDALIKEMEQERSQFYGNRLSTTEPNRAKWDTASQSWLTNSPAGGTQ
jgi:hypothetical protein